MRPNRNWHPSRGYLNRAPSRGQTGDAMRWPLTRRPPKVVKVKIKNIKIKPQGNTGPDSLPASCLSRR